MIKSFVRSLTLLLVLGVILCGVYPAVITLIGRVIFPDKASGSLLVREGVPVGSRLIGQSFTSPKYFHGRPSAAGEKGYDALQSGGTNLGPTSAKLEKRLNETIETVLSENPSLSRGRIPTDLITSSASGLDPHISPESARAQVPRVAQARGIDENDVMLLVERNQDRPILGLFGENKVNVLELNVALDDLAKNPPR